MLYKVVVTFKGLFTLAIFVALKLQQVSNMFETPAISRGKLSHVVIKYCMHKQEFKLIYQN